MKIICDTNILSKACQNIQRSVSSKATLPALDCILIKTTADGINLTGYDLEIGTETSISAFVEEKGEIAINGRYLCDILRLLPDTKVKIETDEKYMCKITSGEAEYSIIGTPADTYPELPDVTGTIPVTISQEILKDMIRKTIYAVSVGDSKPVHTGIKFEIENNKIILIALDGFRLAIRREDIDYNGEKMNFVVPAKTLNEIMKLADSEDEEAVYQLSVGKRHIVFTMGEYKLISRLLEGDFLDYKSAIPAYFKTNIVVERRELIESVERVSLLVSAEKIKTPIRCLAEDNMMKLSNTTSAGKAKDRCIAETDGDSIEIGFNGRYMLDALKVCDEEKVNIELNGSVSPIIITPINNDKFLFLILPMRLKNETES